MKYVKKPLFRVGFVLLILVGAVAILLGIKYVLLRPKVIREQINTLHIAALDAELSSDSIDGSDGIDFWPGTYFVYKTNLGRYGKLIVEGLDKAANNKLTISWVTYDSVGSIYSSGSGLIIRGTWICDLDEGVELGSIKGQEDWWWEQVNSSTRYLVPRNSAKFKLIYRGSKGFTPLIRPIEDTTITKGLAYLGPTPSLQQGTLPLNWSLGVCPSNSFKQHFFLSS